MTEKVIAEITILCKLMDIEIWKIYIYKLIKKQHCKLNKNCIHNKLKFIKIFKIAISLL